MTRFEILFLDNQPVVDGFEHVSVNFDDFSVISYEAVDFRFDVCQLSVNRSGQSVLHCGFHFALKKLLEAAVQILFAPVNLVAENFVGKDVAFFLIAVAAVLGKHHRSRQFSVTCPGTQLTTA